MNINDLLKEQKMSKYRLSIMSGATLSTVGEITTGKSKIENCTGANLYRIAKALGVTMEDLLADSMEYRHGFDTFKSNVCHRVHDMGDMDFIIETLETDKIRKLYQRQWYPEALYLLAMVDYLSRENDLPLCNAYNDLRAARLREPVYPSSVIVMSIAADSDQPKKDSYADAIPEFRRFNIVEGDIRNVI
jgi:transcriptional regulator with XRE-family HTH domain